MSDSATALHLEGADGLRIVAEFWGDPADAPVLLSHGGGQTRYSWQCTAQERLVAATKNIEIPLMLVRSREINVVT